MFEKIEYDIDFIGFVSDEAWPHFLWSVEINGERFTYKTGVGHCEVYRPTDKKGFVQVKIKDKYRSIFKTRNNIIWAKKPDIKDVLYCLCSDAEAIDMSFHDWCGTFGYDDDSISAFNIYKECCENGYKLAKALGGRKKVEKIGGWFYENEY